MEFFAAVPAAIGRSLPQILADSGRFGLFILCITFVLSVMTWAVVWDRARLYARLRAKGDALRKAMVTRGIGPCVAEAEHFLPSVEAALLLETRRFVAGRAVDGVLVTDDPALADSERSRLKGLLEARAMNEIGEMERHLILLSTTASMAPFLGLLGTVWGIMHSFLSMGVEGAASIEVIGPGIAEALITTIAGLAAAIPALVAYNVFVRAVQRKETQLDLYISRVLDGVIVMQGGAQRSMNSPRPARTGAGA
ncbi:MAG: MotA/TolQ/ExbB proton channel family protein [Candidatus Krumholzibacteria bacterium]|nr:MotA/TolQ/ExbB proton channel family protein [Candidatus Krumholzibacteria bacterium]MDH4336037.1 MotA/TolQ/ExbB proton channel family protein [Candidatus Krumholzibacteria bacterium]MDH5268387.1 MotA/TolQ/ExbB proton channel family protein [Candidatus Krumholzibacteria bacterium]